MSTKYSPYASIKSIYELKKKWDEENSAGNAPGANLAAQNAKKYYEELKNNGYNDVADQLKKTDYVGAKDIVDSYAGTGGKTAIRPFFRSLAKSANLSEDEVNNLIKYDGKTGHVSFAGTDIGRPDATADGVSYWDKDYLQGVWDSYMKSSKADDYNGVKGNATYNGRMGSAIGKNDEQWEQFDEHNSYIRSEYDKLLSLANTPYSESEEYKAAMKAIMPYYDYAGNKAAYGATADGASSNSGNVDTFAAANAARQRNAQIAQGAQLAYKLGLEPYQQRLENIRNILSAIGVQRESLTEQQNSNISSDINAAQVAFEAGEAQRKNEHTMSEEKMNNATARKEVEAGIDLAKDTLDAETTLGWAKLASDETKENDDYISTHGVAITPIPNTLPASASDEEERKAVKGYESKNLNNLSARFINELSAIGETVSIKNVLSAIANRSDAYGLTINDVYAILDYLDLGAYKNYFKQIDKTGRTDEPGVMLTKKI